MDKYTPQERAEILAPDVNRILSQNARGCCEQSTSVRDALLSTNLGQRVMRLVPTLRSPRDFSEISRNFALQLP
ncbi:hypothetical protein GWI33_014375 [Rhynchophorus ferrugineus]|uniref:Uncharacterized protein n=1 Tax=Rhynchophorus ferrugineus TaxID=354439 RepID=A0A834I1L7_RHYFE|nr:hypothetical protein GWI33_014375 [Rhynchophorus ferrugineus]